MFNSFLIFSPQVCDGVLHCPDGEDESKCERKQLDIKEEPREEENDIFSKDVVNSKAVQDPVICYYFEVKCH